MFLFCLPYAGGSKAIYYNWKKYISSSIELELIELKGRGSRYGEKFYNSIAEAVCDIYINIREKISHDKYAIFGHSMGGLLAYELYYKIDSENLRKPEYMFFSGCNAPNIKGTRKKLYNLNDADFLEEIFSLGGTSKEILENTELRQLCLPILRNDIRMTEDYIFSEKKNKIECGVTIFRGQDDSVSLESALSWKNYSANEFSLYELPGNHFFINNNSEDITKIINSKLC